jgi:hypothetical protein
MRGLIRLTVQEGAEKVANKLTHSLHPLSKRTSGRHRDMAVLALRAEDALQSVRLGEECVKYRVSMYLCQIGYNTSTPFIA